MGFWHSNVVVVVVVHTPNKRHAPRGGDAALWRGPPGRQVALRPLPGLRQGAGAGRAGGA